MKEDEKIEEEVVEEKTDLEKSAEDAKAKEESEEEADTEILDMNKEFDKKIDTEDTGEENNAAEEKAEPEQAEADKKAEEEKAKAKEAEDKIPAKEKEAKTPEFSDELLERAVKAGYSLIEAKEFSTPKDLERAVSKFKAGEKEEEPEKFECGLDPEKYDEEFIKLSNELGQLKLDMKKQAESGTKTSAEEKAKAEEAELSRRAEEHDNWLDKQFTGNKDFEEELGTETVDKIDRESEQFKNRVKVQKKFAILAKGYIAAEEDLPTREELFEEALNSVFTEKVKRIAVKGTKEKLAKQAGQVLGRPGSKVAAESGEALVKKTNADFDAKLDAE